MDWKTLTSLGRFKDIIMVLLRYGFDDLVDRLNIPGTKFMRKKSPIDHPLDTFERIRYACEELGPTVVQVRTDGESATGPGAAGVDRRTQQTSR